MKFTKIFMLGALALGLSVTSCKKAEDTPMEEINEVELFTTVILDFVAQDSTAAEFSFTAVDLDGEGGNPIEIDAVELPANTEFKLTLTFLDESGDEVVNMTEEVLDEDDEHLVCFNTSTDITIMPTDTDGMYAVGIENDVTTQDPTEGELMVTLKHQPGVKDGTCAPGETDIEVTFPVTVM